MDFRTEVFPGKEREKISYSDRVMFIGSCFAGEMAVKFSEGLMPVLGNPSGTLYNPASIASTLRNLINERRFTAADLWQHEGKWLSFSHYTEFSSLDIGECIGRINTSAVSASRFLKKAAFLFVTLGTARVYRRRDTGEIVANCHKLPAAFFENDLLQPEEITEDWTRLTDELIAFNPGLRIVFTVSPVRHWKDGPLGNQVSKSALFLSIDKLLKHPARPGYFPSYELLMDDLRDYRWYAADMLHPSGSAVDYIWEKFSSAFLEPSTEELRREIAAITRASRHRVSGNSAGEIRRFADIMLNRIDKIALRNPDIDFSTLRNYFLSLNE